MMLLSVVVPVYNSEKTIERCMRSIMGQTYRNLEIIVVIDGGEEQSYHICENLANVDKRIKVLKNEHLGVTATRKVGVNMAKGEYVAFVDSDDWIEEYYFEKLMEDIDDVDMVIMDCYIVEHKNQQINSHFPQHIKEGTYFGDRIKDIWELAASPNGIDCCLWNRICKTSLIKISVNNVPDNIYLMEDYAISLQALLMCDKVRILDIMGYHYCVRSDSIVHSIHRDYLYNLHLLYTFMLKVLKDHNYKETLVPCFSQYMRYLISRSPESLGLKGVRDEEKLDIYYVNIYYPYFGRLRKSRLVLYGAGYVGQAFYYHIINDNEAELVAWVDKAFYKYKDLKEKVCSPDEINNVEFDYIILAVWEEKVAVEIKKELVKKGILEDIILWNATKRITAEL